MNVREIQLRKLGFHLNEHQDCYILFKYDSTWYIDLEKIRDYDEIKWSILIDDLIYDLQQTKIYFIGDLKESEGYSLAKKEIKQKLLNELNKYRSWLQQLAHFKLDKTVNQEAIIRLEAKVEVIKQLIKL